MKRIAELLLAATLTGFIAFQVGSCGADETRGQLDRARASERALLRAVDSLRTTQSKTDTITERVITRDWRLTAERDSLIQVLRYADSVRTDSTATMADLRETIAVLGGSAIRFETEAMAYRDSVRTLIAMHALERQATNTALAASDSTIAAWKRVVAAERRKSRRAALCGVGGASIGAVSGAAIGGPVGALVGALGVGGVGAVSCR